jgi:hypothetical protein
MCIFTVYIGCMLLFAPDLPCSCGGIIRQLSWKQHLLLNLFLLVLAGIAVRVHRSPVFNQQPKYLLQ